MTPPTRLTPVPAEIVDAFRAVAPTLEEFARQHDLLIERYRRGKPAWELRFARRASSAAGGRAGHDRPLDPGRSGTPTRSIQSLAQQPGRRDLAPAVTEPADRSEEQELWQAFGRAIGFTLAAILLAVGGGILLIVVAAAFFRFMYGG